MHNFDLLNESQRNAVTRTEGPLLLLAGPGSGKTTVIVSHVLYLISKGVSPEQILVITFTKEAALSMNKRFISIADKQYSVTFSTFHAFFYHILRKINSYNSLQLIPHQRKLSILKNVLYKYSHQMDLNEEEQVVEDCLAAIGLYKNTEDAERTFTVLPEVFKKSFFEILRDYQNSMAQNQFYDFDDMLYQTYSLLQKNAEALEYWRKRFSYICIDEFQDINPMQYKILRLLTRRESNIFAVGDDDQSIYGFRGSDPLILKQFALEYEAKVLYLNENYRCVPEIVRASQTVIEENKNRYSKNLFSMAENTGEKAITFVPVTDRKEQYKWLTEELKKREKDRETTAVLFRTNTYLQGLAAKLTAQGIAFTVREGGRSIYEHFVARDIFAYLKLADGTAARRDVIRIINKPVRFVHREAIDESGTIHSIIKYYENAEQQYHSGKTQLQLLEKLKAHMKQLRKMSLPLRIQYLLKAVRYEEYLKAKAIGDNEKTEEWLDIVTLLKQEAAGFATVGEWLSDIENRGTEHRHRNQEKENAIVLLTMHASKGLEFDHVFIPDCNEKMYPHGTLLDSETIEEERRLFYVGMTRAKKTIHFIYLTGDKVRPKYPSKFIEPFLTKDKGQK